MRKRLQFSLIPVASWILVLFLIVCNGLLIRQNWQFRNEIEDLVREQRVQVGEKFGDLAGVDPENNPVTINSEAGVKKVIFLFSTSCPYCKKQNAYWIECVKQLDPKKYETIALFNEREERQTAVDYLNKYGYLASDLSLKVLFSPDDILQK